MNSLAIISIGIDPNILNAGGVLLSWHGFFTALGILGAILWARRQAKRYGFNDDIVYGTAVWGIIGGILGARMVHVIDFWGYYSQNPLLILQVWTGGIALMGGVLGAAIGGSLYAWRNRYPVGRMVDLVAPGIVLGQAIGRIGDIINGEHLANLTALPWAFLYTHPDSLAQGKGPMHPAIAYEMIWDGVLFFVLLKLIGRLRPDGMVFFSYMALYGLGRFFIQFLRQDAIWFAGLQQAHLMALIMVLVGVAVVATRARLVSAAEREESTPSQV